MGTTVSPSLNKSSDEWVVPLTKVSRGWYMTDVIGYNNKALEADDDCSAHVDPCCSRNI
jgi:hypothetical protein